VGVCDDGAGARGRGDAGAGGAGGGAGGHVQRAGSGKHAVGVCDDGAEARGRGDAGAGGRERIEKLSSTVNANSRAKERTAACHV